MNMTFSLKRMFIGVTYIVVAAAACAQPADGWKNSFWLVTVLAMLYAALAVCYFRRRRRAIAVGFLLFATSHVAALWLSPATMPTKYIGQLIGVYAPDDLDQGKALLAEMERSHYELVVSTNSASDEYRERAQGRYKKTLDRMSAYASNQTREETVNAIATMLAGVIGCLVGAHVWAIANRTEEE